MCNTGGESQKSSFLNCYNQCIPFVFLIENLLLAHWQIAGVVQASIMQSSNPKHCAG